MERSIVEQAQSALRDLVGMVPQGDRNGYVAGDVATIEQALSLLAEALAFRSAIEVQAQRLAASATHAAERAEQ